MQLELSRNLLIPALLFHNQYEDLHCQNFYNIIVNLKLGRGLTLRQIVLLVQDNSRQHFSLLKLKFCCEAEQPISDPYGEYCNLTLCLHLIEPNLSPNVFLQQFTLEKRPVPQFIRHHYFFMINVESPYRRQHQSRYQLAAL